VKKLKASEVCLNNYNSPSGIQDILEMILVFSQSDVHGFGSWGFLFHLLATAVELIT
jgi:hypothetical protein